MQLFFIVRDTLVGKRFGWIRILTVKASLFFLLPLLSAQSDSTRLDFYDYLAMVRDHHPLTYQARLLGNIADSKLLSARGSFDPKLEAAYQQKSFDGKNYYQTLGGALKVPTWFGLDLKTSFEKNQGEFLNPTEFVPNSGLWSFGISVPLGNGLMIDERRAEIQRARLFGQMATQEQLLLINELVYEAVVAYLEWQEKYQSLLIAQEGVELARQRLQATKSSFLQGDKPAVDTLESYLSLQSRQQLLTGAEQAYDNARTGMLIYLWLDGEIPLELGLNSSPVLLDSSAFEWYFDSVSIRRNELIVNHPLLNQYDLKMDQLNIDIKLNREALKPDIRLDFFPITRPDLSDFAVSNHKLGATFYYPIMQRKVRGKMRENELKLQDVGYEVLQKRRDLEVKLDVYQQTTENEKVQWMMASEIVENYRQLLIAENRKFSVGESSLFVLNSRENSYLESRSKQVKVLKNLLKSRLSYLYVAGMAGNL